MGVYETDSTCSHTILKAMFSVREDKAVELQFTVGEAVSCVAAGSLSTALRSPWELGGRDRLVSRRGVQLYVVVFLY